MTRAREFANFGSDAPSAIGTAGQALLVNSGATAYEWAEAGGGSRTLSQTVTASSDSTVLIGSSSLLSSTYKRYEILVENAVATTTIIGRVSIGGAVKTANYMWGFLDMLHKLSTDSNHKMVSQLKLFQNI